MCNRRRPAVQRRNSLVLHLAREHDGGFPIPVGIIPSVAQIEPQTELRNSYLANCGHFHPITVPGFLRYIRGHLHHPRRTPKPRPHHGETCRRPFGDISRPRRHPCRHNCPGPLSLGRSHNIHIGCATYGGYGIIQLESCRPLYTVPTMRG